MQALAAGASAFLAKPVVPLQFVSTVRDLLGSSALTRRSPRERLLMERLSTGNARLDEVLGGGLVLERDHAGGRRARVPARRSWPSNACSPTPRRERPGLYLSTVSEPFDKLLRYGQSLEFFDPAQVGRSVFYDDLGDAVHHDGLAGVLERIDALVKEHQPGIIVIDSFKALRTFAADDAEFRRFLHDLAGRLTALAVSSLWVGEYEPDEATDSPEFAVADAVIGLETKRSAERSIRYLSVRKLRGSDFLSGDHVYRITAGGLSFPSPRRPSRQRRATASIGERVSTGIAALDDALEDGYWPGSTTLIAGPSGAGKTLMGLHFVFAGAARDEPGDLRHAAREPDPAGPRHRPVRLDHRRPQRDDHGPLTGRPLHRRARLRVARPDRARSAPAGSSSTASTTSSPPRPTRCASASSSTHSCNAAPGSASA